MRARTRRQVPDRPGLASGVVAGARCWRRRGDLHAAGPDLGTARRRRAGRAPGARRRLAIVTTLALLAAALVVATGSSPAFASSSPGVPGTPVAIGMHGGAALQWSAPPMSVRRR